MHLATAAMVPLSAQETTNERQKVSYKVIAHGEDRHDCTDDLPFANQTAMGTIVQCECGRYWYVDGWHTWEPVRWYQFWIKNKIKNLT